MEPRGLFLIILKYIYQFLSQHRGTWWKVIKTFCWLSLTRRWLKITKILLTSYLNDPYYRRTLLINTDKNVCFDKCSRDFLTTTELIIFFFFHLYQDDKLTILATLFWVGASLLESDYEHEFLLGVRLLSRVMARLPLDRPDARERLDRTQAHGTHGPSSLHSLLLKVGPF